MLSMSTNASTDRDSSSEVSVTERPSTSSESSSILLLHD